MKQAGLLLGCLILVTSSAMQAMAQSARGTLPSYVAEPIKITILPIKARRSESAKSWMSQPIVRVANVSNKPIEYFIVETKLPGSTTPFMLVYGHAPGKAFKSVEPLQPGAKMDLTVDQNVCEAAKSRLLEINARSLVGSRVATRINGVVFNDKTAWFDGLPHVMDPNNPRHWTVVRTTATATDLNDSPMFGFLKAGYRESSSFTAKPQMCWDRLGTEWVDCCGDMIASAVMVQVWGGVFEPFPMESECEPGVFCEWTKQVGCF